MGVGGGGPGSSDCGPPQSYQSQMDASNMTTAQEAAKVVCQRAEIQAVLVQYQQAVHDQQRQQQGSREDDSACTNAIAALVSEAASGNVSAEEAVSRIGAVSAISQ